MASTRLDEIGARGGTECCCIRPTQPISEGGMEVWRGYYFYYFINGARLLPYLHSGGGDWLSRKITGYRCPAKRSECVDKVHGGGVDWLGAERATPGVYV